MAVDACPECDKAHIHRRRSQSPEWFCTACGAEFDEPVERETKHTNSGHAQALVDADPDIITNRRKT